MKKKLFSLTLALLILAAMPLTAFANMAAPADPDTGSNITFEKNDVITVVSEVLDITVTGSTAQITAAYAMENTSAEPVTTPAMFLSPNIQESVRVRIAGEDALFTTQTYCLTYDSDVGADGWEYAILAPSDNPYNTRTVDAIRFEIPFAPNEAREVRVSYTYRLGGYPEVDFNAKRGEIEYYLTPAALWQDFHDLTINLTLDKDMPVIQKSSVPFEKVAPRTYRCHLDAMPQSDLKITIDQNWYQSIISWFRSPYLMGELLIAVVPLLAPCLLVLLGLWVHRHRERKSQAAN